MLSGPILQEHMFESVLGVDPGVASLGLAVLTREGADFRIAWWENVRTPADLAEPLRLLRLGEAVRAAIADHAPSSVAMERVMWNRNVTSGMQVARASGVILLAAAEAGLEVEEYGPLEVKMAATGSGTAPKEQVRAALARYGIGEVPKQPDAADAVAVAYCHMQGARLRRAAREAAAR